MSHDFELVILRAGTVVAVATVAPTGTVSVPIMEWRAKVLDDVFQLPKHEPVGLSVREVQMIGEFPRSSFYYETSPTICTLRTVPLKTPLLARKRGFWNRVFKVFESSNR